MRRTILAAALASALLGGWALPATAQQNGIVIQNNGADNFDSAAGADNVRVSRAPGNSSSNNGAGTGNEERRAARENRDRGDRGSRKNAEGGADAAPVEEAAAPAEGDLQAYGDPGYVEPAPEPAPEPVDAAQVVALPDTGVGAAGLPPLATLAAAIAAAFGTVALRKRRTT